MKNWGEPLCEGTGNYGENTMHGAFCFERGTVCADFIIPVIIFASCKETDECDGKLLHYFRASLKIFYFFQRLEDRKSVAR